MNPRTEPQSPRDGIRVPDEFAAELAARATQRAAGASRRPLRLRPLVWTAAAAAAVFAGILLTLGPVSQPSAEVRPGLTVDEAWSALEQGEVTLTDDELIELAEQHGITHL
jgi:hypothetical protein